MAWLTDSRVLEMLLEALIKSTALLAIGLVTAGLFRKQSAALRHFILSVFVIGLLFLPVLSFLPAGWGTRLLPSSLLSYRAGAFDRLPAGADREKMPLDRLNGRDAKNGPAGSIIRLKGDKGETEVLVPAGRLSAEQSPLPRLAGAAAAVIWFGVAVFLLVRLAAGLAGAARLSREGVALEGSGWQSILRRFMAVVSLRRRVRLKSHGSVAVPLTWGVIKPVVLMPAEAENWTDEERSSALFHELSHVKRVDFLVMMLVRVSLALYWFNPLGRLAVRRLKKEQEKACDELVLRAGIKPSTYAANLLALKRSAAVRWSPSVALLGLLGMTAGSPLNDRLVTILADNPLKEIRMKTKLALFAIVIFAVALIGMARPAAPQTAASQADKVTMSNPAGQSAGQESATADKQEKPKTAPKTEKEKARAKKARPAVNSAPAAGSAVAPQPLPVVPAQPAAGTAPVAAAPLAQPVAGEAAMPAPQPAVPGVQAPRASASLQPVTPLEPAPRVPSPSRPEAAAPPSPGQPVPAPGAIAVEPVAPAPDQDAEVLQHKTVVVKPRHAKEGRFQIVITEGDKTRSIKPDHEVVIVPDGTAKVVTVRPQGWTFDIGEGKHVRVVVKNGTIALDGRNGGVRVDERSRLVTRTDESGQDVVVVYEIPGLIIHEDGADLEHLEFKGLEHIELDHTGKFEFIRDVEGRAREEQIAAAMKGNDERLRKELEETQRRLEELEQHKTDLQRTLKEAAETMTRVENEAVRARMAELNGKLSKEVESSIRESEEALKRSLEQTQRRLKEVSEALDHTKVLVDYAEGWAHEADRAREAEMAARDAELAAREKELARGGGRTESGTIVTDKGKTEVRNGTHVRGEKGDKVVVTTIIDGGFKLAFHGFMDSTKKGNLERAIERMRKELPKGATLDSDIGEDDLTVTVTIRGLKQDDEMADLQAKLAKIFRAAMK